MLSENIVTALFHSMLHTHKSKLKYGAGIGVEKFSQINKNVCNSIALDLEAKHNIDYKHPQNKVAFRNGVYNFLVGEDIITPYR